jgi:hypothetical protein
MFYRFTRFIGFFEHSYFTAIDVLFNEGINLPSASLGETTSTWFMYSCYFETTSKLLKSCVFCITGDRFSWFRDEEFARETLVGHGMVFTPVASKFNFLGTIALETIRVDWDHKMPWFFKIILYPTINEKVHQILWDQTCKTWGMTDINKEIKKVGANKETCYM